MTASGPLRRPFLPWLMLAYAGLLVAGRFSGSELPFRLAVPVLAAMLACALPMHRRLVAAGWVLASIGMLWLGWKGHVHAILDSLPILISLALCMVFARTLWPGHEPLVTRIVRVMEGPERLDTPGIATYTRRVTGYWAVLLGAQSVLLCASWIVVATGWGGAQAWARGYLHLGGYLMPVLAMTAEYLLRRWRFRHLPQPGPLTFIRQLVACWPKIVQGRHDTLDAS